MDVGLKVFIQNVKMVKINGKSVKKIKKAFDIRPDVSFASLLCIFECIY